MPIGITKNLTTWRFQDHHVERMMDNAAYTSAHPDDTLILAGAARRDSITLSDTNGIKSLMAVGMVQSLQLQQAKSTQPMMAIGSGRSFFVSGKSQGSGSMARLFMNGRNLLRALYHNARTQSLDVSKLDDPAAISSDSGLYMNLDSELYLIPFGLGLIYRTKSHEPVGGMYIELTMITTYNMGFNAGGNSIMEQVGFVFDRVLPLDTGTLPQAQIPKATLDAVLNLIDRTDSDVQTENLVNADVTPFT